MPTIYLDPFEEITSVIEHLRNTKEKDVVLFIPEGAVIFQSMINLRLLKNEAMKLGKDLSLVTADEYGKSIIRQAGLNAVKQDVDPKEFLNIEETAGVESLPQMNDIKTTENTPEFSKEDSEVSEEDSEATPDKDSATMEKEDSNVVSDLTFNSNSRSISFSRLTSATLREQKSALQPRKIVDIVPRQSLGAGAARPRIQPKKFFSKRTKNIFRKIPGAIKIPEAIEKGQESLGAVYKIKSSLLSKFSGFSRILFWLFISISFLAGVLVIIKVLPRVAITIIPVTDNFTADVGVAAEEGVLKVDFNNKMIPGQKLEVSEDGSKEFSATGEREIREKAKGIITIYNEWSSQYQNLVVNTRFVTEDEKIFRTIKLITVPGASIVEGKSVPGVIDVDVIADQPGEDYNIGPARFSIPGFKGSVKYMTIYGKSKNSMSGGAIGKFKVVSDDDYNKARDLLKDELSGKIIEDLNRALPNSFVLLKDAIKEEIANITSSVEKGQRAENFSLSMKLRASTLVFSGEDIKELANNVAASNAASDKIIVPNSLNISYKKVEFDKNKLNMNINISSKFASKIDTEKIKRELSRKKEKEIREYLSSQEGISSAKVSFWPFWVEKVPNDASGVKVNIEYN